MLEIFTTMSKVIRLQTDAIDRAVALLLQHVQTDDEALGEILELRESAQELQKGIDYGQE